MTGSRTRLPTVQITGSPNAQPGRSQPVGGGAGGSASCAGSSGSSGGASGPTPKRPATENAAVTPPASRSRPTATVTANVDGDAASGPSATVAWRPASGIASRPIATPRAAGAATAKRTSSSDQAMGWNTVTAVAMRVRPIINMTNR